MYEGCLSTGSYRVVDSLGARLLSCINETAPLNESFLVLL